MPTRIAADAVLDAAADVLAGDHGASMEEIARAIGMSRATLHRMYPTRSALVRAIAMGTIELLDAALARVEEAVDAGVDGVDALVGELLPITQRYSFLTFYPDLEDVSDFDRCYERMSAVVAIERQRGRIHADVPPAWVLDALVALVVTAARAVREGSIAQRDARALVVRVVRGGLGTAAR